MVCAGAALPVAAQTPVDDYAAVIHHALSLVQFAEKGDVPSRQQAILTVERLPGPPQVEILSDLRAAQPRLVDADQRLQALYQALQQHVDTPDPAVAQRQLRDVLGMPRYTGLGTGPSLAERVVAAVLDGIRRLLSWLGVGKLHLNVPLWIWFGLAGLVILAIIVWPIRGAIIPGGRQARTVPGPAAAAPSLDFFAAADRLANAGDYVGAIRALAGGVAVRLNGERVWDQSPFTVRELFARAEQPETLRPLLRSFEEASYGQRRPDRASYARAAEAAERYRRQAA